MLGFYLPKPSSHAIIPNLHGLGLVMLLKQIQSAPKTMGKPNQHVKSDCGSKHDDNHDP